MMLSLLNTEDGNADTLLPKYTASVFFLGRWQGAGSSGKSVCIILIIHAASCHGILQSSALLWKDQVYRVSL